MRHKPHQLFLGMVVLSAALHGVVSVVQWPQGSTTSAVQDDAQALERQVAIATETPAIVIAQLPQRNTVAPKSASTFSPALAAQSLPQYPLPEDSIAASALAQSPPLDLPPQSPPQSAEEEALFENSKEQAALDSENIDSEVEDSEEDLGAEDSEEDLDAEDLKQGSEPDQGVLLQLADDFPHLSGSSSGCFSLSNCHQASGNYRQVVQQLTEQMIANGYQLTEDDTIDGTGHRVFEVVMPSEPDSLYYLNVFSDGLDSAVYAITVNILSLDELKSLQA